MIHAAVMIRREQDGWKAVVHDALDKEFPADTEMRVFVEASFSEIVRLLLKGHKTVHIHRSVSHGLELFVGTSDVVPLTTPLAPAPLRVIRAAMQES
jgi:hypothetical protein